MSDCQVIFAESQLDTVLGAHPGQLAGAPGPMDPSGVGAQSRKRAEPGSRCRHTQHHGFCPLDVIIWGLGCTVRGNEFCVLMTFN